VILILLSTLVSQSICLNALFISVGAAGHVTPMFELAKAMKNHNVTFLTQQLAKSYIDLNLSSSPLFRIIYTNDSADAFSDEKYLEQQLLQSMANQSVFDALPEVALVLSNLIIPMLHKTIDMLTYDRFDVIVAGTAIFGVPVLCEKIQTPCVIQSAMSPPNIFDLNLPKPFSLLTSKELTQLTYRIYNAAITARSAIKVIPKMIPTLYTIFQSLPNVPGPFYDSYTLKNLLFSKSKCLNLISMPSTFYTPSYSHHSIKYLGAFMDETTIDNDDDDTLTTWIKSKPISSIVYGAFGSSSLIPYDRMYNLINGLAKFLLQTDDSFLLLALRSANYDTYKVVLKDVRNDEIRKVLENKQRVWIEKGFVKQKWILQQKSIKMFISHCGMGSAMEALYYSKPIVCMPFNMDQFTNAIAIEDLKVGQSLFVPPSAIQNFLNPYNLVQYNFTAESVTSKISDIWMNVAYEKAARGMSLEMKHAGGVKRAVEDIEFFVNLDGNLDHFAPFQSTLWFYQRYLLDLLLIFVILPGLIIIYIVLKCCKRQRKTKTD
jgi:UDP:flavonoid glycosyltransferase YjiC (YdhE family)